MNTTLKIITALAAGVCIGCTVIDEKLLEDGGDALIGIEVDYDGYRAAVRSSVSAGESEINDIQILVIDAAGEVTADIYTSYTGSPIKFKGRVGETYKVYAVANNGSRITGLAREADIKSWRYETVPSQAFPFGIPMAGTSEGTFKAVSGQSNVTVTLKRLAARIDFTLSGEDISDHGTFLATSLRLKACPTSVVPFADTPVQAVSVADGDSASAADITALNAGKTVSLYLLENLRGTLLPSNTDPWAKIPDNIGTAASSCSYIEVQGNYSSVGYGGKDTYRMFPGADNTTNFDIRRNTSYKIRFCPSDDNMRLGGNWKITPSEWNDSRELSFSTTSLSIKQGKSETITVQMLPGNFDIIVSDSGFEEAGLSWSRSGNSVTISCSASASVGKTGVLRISSWDGKVTASCNVTVQSNGSWFYDLIVTPDSATLRVGETISLQATYLSEYTENGVRLISSSQDVTDSASTRWSSNDESILTVDNHGNVTAVGPGYAVIACIYGGGVGGCSIKVIP